MRLLRKIALPVMGVLVLAASTAPGASADIASTLPGVGPTPGAGGAQNASPCGTAGAASVGATGNYSATICQGAGLTFTGPGIGEIASVVGPTIISPAVVAPIMTSTGPIIVGW